MLELISILVAGFSVVSAAILFITFAFLMPFPHKSWHSLLSGGLLVISLIAIQLSHARYFMGAGAPLDSTLYLAALFIVPSMFYFFSRSIITPTRAPEPWMVVLLTPLAAPFLFRLEIALPILFLFGAAYSVWFAVLIFNLRDRRRQFRFELFFFATLSVIAVFVLVLGFSIPYIDDRWFYLVYTNGLGLAIVLTVAALVAIPDLVGDLAEAGRIRYSASTLGGVDVDGCLAKLDALMRAEHAYRDENLSLASLAESLGLSSQQLSELINTRLGTGFSRYVRERRVEAAKALLGSAPSRSILSVSLDVGFKSQSSFYAAFKEVTGMSPGDYRKANSAGPDSS